MRKILFLVVLAPFAASAQLTIEQGEWLLAIRNYIYDIFRNGIPSIISHLNTIESDQYDLLNRLNVSSDNIYTALTNNFRRSYSSDMRVVTNVLEVVSNSEKRLLTISTNTANSAKYLRYIEHEMTNITDAVLKTYYEINDWAESDYTVHDPYTRQLRTIITGLPYSVGDESNSLNGRKSIWDAVISSDNYLKSLNTDTDTIISLLRGINTSNDFNIVITNSAPDYSSVLQDIKTEASAIKGEAAQTKQNVASVEGALIDYLSFRGNGGDDSPVLPALYDTVQQIGRNNLGIGEHLTNDTSKLARNADYFYNVFTNEYGYSSWLHSLPGWASNRPGSSSSLPSPFYAFDGSGNIRTVPIPSTSVGERKHDFLWWFQRLMGWQFNLSGFANQFDYYKYSALTNILRSVDNLSVGVTNRIAISFTNDFSSLTGLVDVISGGFRDVTNGQYHIIEGLTPLTNYVDRVLGLDWSSPVHGFRDSSYTNNFHAYLTNEYFRISSKGLSGTDTRTNWFNRVEILLAALVFPDDTAPATNYLDSADAQSKTRQFVDAAGEALGDDGSRQGYIDNFAGYGESVVSAIAKFASIFDGVALGSQLVFVDYSPESGEGGETSNRSLVLSTELTKEDIVFFDLVRSLTSFVWLLFCLAAVLRFSLWILHLFWWAVRYAWQVLQLYKGGGE